MAVREIATPSAFKLPEVMKYGDRNVNAIPRTTSAIASPTSSKRPKTYDCRIRVINEILGLALAFDITSLPVFPITVPNVGRIKTNGAGVMHTGSE